MTGLASLADPRKGMEKALLALGVASEPSEDIGGDAPSFLAN
jgi:hypothetical protein